MDALLEYYMKAKRYTESRHPERLRKYREIRLEQVTFQAFLKEYAWVVFQAGLKETILRRLFPKIEESYGMFVPDSVSPDSVHAALCVINNKAKCQAVLQTAETIKGIGFDRFVQETAEQGVDRLEQLPFIGPKTKYHLARNIGLDVVKPDIWQERIAQKHGFATPLEMCRWLQRKDHERLGVIDLILWQYSSETGDV